MYDSEIHSKFIELRARGLTLSKIAEQLTISFHTARNWDHEHYEQIRDLRDNLSALFVDRFLPDYGEHLDSLTAELERINAQLEKRDYAKESTWVLVNRQSMILSRLDKVRANPPLLIAPPIPPPNPHLSTKNPLLDPDYNPNAKRNLNSDLDPDRDSDLSESP